MIHCFPVTMKNVSYMFDRENRYKQEIEKAENALYEFKEFFPENAVEYFVMNRVNRLAVAGID